MPAIGNILAKMMTANREKLEKEHERFKLEGNNEEDKQRLVLTHCQSSSLTKYLRLAKKSSGPKLDQSAKQNWLEMGLLSVTFYVHTTPSGQLAVEL